jgi:hypothetical protein
MQAGTGRIRITTIIAKAGSCTKGIGTAKTTTITTGRIALGATRTIRIAVASITIRLVRESTLLLRGTLGTKMVIVECGRP